MTDIESFFSELDPRGLTDQVVFGNTVIAWLGAIGIACAAFFALLLARRLLVGRVRSLGKRLPKDLSELLVALAERTSRFLLFLLALGIAAAPLVIPDRFVHLGRIALVVAFTWQAVLWSQHLVTYGLRLFLRSQGSDADPAVLTGLGVARFIALALVYLVIGLLALQNAGVEVGPLIASLGIGGIAVALAAQNVLGDLFASLSIVLDKPFVVGDFIVVGDQMGTVENIGVKTTRLRALSGEQLVFSNNDLLTSRVQNFKRMRERRVVFALGVVYQTTEEQLRKVPGVIRAAIESQSDTRFDRAHFKGFGASSLDFEAVYYVLSAEYNVYMDRHQAVNLAILGRFAREGIQFAYPTRTIFIERSGSADEAEDAVAASR